MNTQDTERFFEAQYGDINEGYLELRAIHSDDGPRGSNYVSLDAQGAAARFIEVISDASAEGVNIYHGVATRMRRGGRKADCAFVPALWCDVDILNLTREEVLERIKTAGLPDPSILLFSGGGWHIYWLLEEPVELDGPKGKRTRHIEAINRGIARLIGGDPATWNTDRILRPPGTTNWPNQKKRKDGRAPAPVELVICEDDRRFPLGEFAAVARIGAAKDPGKVVEYEQRPLTDEENVWVESLENDDGPLGKLYRREDCENDSDHDMKLADALARAVQATAENAIVIDEALRRSRDEYGDGKPSEVKGDPYYHLTVGKAVDYVAKFRDRVRALLRDECPDDPLSVVPADAPPWQALLYALNNKHAVLPTESKVRVTAWVDSATGYKTLGSYTPADFRVLYANQFIDVPGQDDPVPVAKYWLSWPGRRTVEGVVFDPRSEHADKINLWQGLGVERDVMGIGSWALLERLMREGICNSNEEDFAYLMKWCAWFVQNPERAAEVAVVLRGEKGTGKGMMASTLGNIAGAHSYALTDPTALLGRFSAHLAHATFVFADEAFWAGSSKEEGRLKALITEKFISTEQKFKDLQMVPNSLHVMIASNESWVVPATGDERRYFVLDVNPKFKPDAAFFKSLHNELYGDGGFGISAFLSDLQDLPLGDWHPREDVPATEGLANQVLATLTPAERFWHDALQEGVFGEGTDWPEEITCEEVHTLCVDAARRLGRGKPPTKIELRKVLNRVCPEIEIARPKAVGATRARCYRLPPITACRAAFEKALHARITWESE